MDIPGKDRSPEELADLLDELMSQGTGHVNIFANENGEGLSVETINSKDCGIKGACCQPNEKSEDDEL